MAKQSQRHDGDALGRRGRMCLPTIEQDLKQKRSCLTSRSLPIRTEGVEVFPVTHYRGLGYFVVPCTREA